MFDFRNDNTSGAFSLLWQFSDNPAVHTKLSCFLPWVAAQYDMDYTPAGEPDPDCLTGNGDINEVTAEVCRTRSYGTWDMTEFIEASCLFPFTLNGESHNSCILGRGSF